MKAKRLLFSMAAISVICSVMALDHGSMMGNAVPLGPQRTGGDATGDRTDLTLDFKVVTVGSKTFAWTNLTNASPDGAGWASQLRYFEPAKTELNLEGRIGSQSYGSARLPNVNPVTITFFQSVDNKFYETTDFIYNYTQLNSADAGDNTAPNLTNASIETQTSMSVKLSLSANDNSGNFFYYVEDAANGVAEVSFLNEITIMLTPLEDYNLSVYAIDFSGNQSTAIVVPILGTPPVYITEGIAKDLSFKLDSRSLTELVIEGTSLATNGFGDVYAKISIDGAWIMGAYGTGSEAPDGKRQWKVDGMDQNGTGERTYLLTIPANEIPGWANGKLLTLDIGYIIAPIPSDWGTYVSPNLIITAGDNTGLPILHQIGTGVNIGTGIASPNANTLSIYPNPVETILNINGLEKAEIAQVLDVTGKTVITCATTGELNVSNLSSGIYILKVENKMLKFVKK